MTELFFYPADSNWNFNSNCSMVSNRILFFLFISVFTHVKSVSLDLIFPCDIKGVSWLHVLSNTNNVTRYNFLTFCCNSAFTVTSAREKVATNNNWL